MRTTAPGQSALLLLDVIDRLEKQSIPYAVIGAFAASFYGVVRASLDADAVIAMRALREGEGLCRALESRGLKVDCRSGDFEDPIRAVINIQDSFHNRVDLLIGIRKMPQEIFRRVEQAQFRGAAINIVGLEDFIAMKIFAGSPKDIQDVIGVLKISGDKMDAVLLRKISAQYGKKCAAESQALLKKYPLKI